jgi:peptidoglycan/xylan/chitin deacetylase (PgdA/CDA1 family)
MRDMDQEFVKMVNRGIGGDPGALAELIHVAPPVPPRAMPRPKAGCVFPNFSSPAWTIGSGGVSGTLADTTSDRPRGTQVTKYVLAGDGAAKNLSLLSISPTLDLDNSWLRIWLWCDHPENVANDNLRFYMSHSNLGAGTFLRINFGFVRTQRILPPSSWKVLDVPLYGSTMINSSDNNATRTAINSLRLTFGDTNGQAAITWKCGGIEFVDTEATDFPNGAVTFTFDDGRTTLPTAETILSKYGFVGTAYIIPEEQPGMGPLPKTWRIDVQELQRLQDQCGWEIGYHDESYFTSARGGLIPRVKYYQALMRYHGFRAWNHCAYVGGNFSYDPAITAHISPGRGVLDQMPRLFSSCRTIYDGMWQPTRPSDPYALTPIYIEADTDVATIKAKIDGVKASKGWAIITCHDVVTSNPTGNDILDTGTHSASDLTVLSLEGIAHYCAGIGLKNRSIGQMMGC